MSQEITMLRDRVRYTAMVIASIAIAACSGPTEPQHHDTTQPPPADSIIGKPTATSVPAGDTIRGGNGIIQFNASATSAQGGTVVYVWTLDGSPVGSGSSIGIPLSLGSHQICVTASVPSTVGKQSCVNKVYVPATKFRIVAADPTSETLRSNLQATLYWGNNNATATVGSDGNGSIQTDAILGTDADSAVMKVQGTSEYHSILVHLSHADLANGFTLLAIPRQFQIQTGWYAGQTLPTDLNLAYVAGSDSTSFYSRTITRNGRWYYSDASMLSSVMPLPVNILAKPQSFSSAGALAVAADLDTTQKIIGWNINQTPVVKDTAFWSKGAIEIVLDTSCANAGIMAHAGKDGMPDIDGGSITYCAEKYVTTGVTSHEEIHFLIDAGHGCGWHSVMNQNCDWGKTFPYLNPADRPTPTDVAYIHLKARVRALERKYNTLYSLGESHQGERVLELGLPEQLITHTR